ncbi:MAG: 50S ribosomal protein L1 [Candidatus Bathyarchaeota archaeon]|nr:50S ribosomal protein L1 [Candidatus Bathyarchaeota archaeon]
MQRDILRKGVVEALRFIEENPRRFKQSVELIVNLRDIDLKKPENRFVDVISLPHGSGKPAKICMIASGALASQARNVGVDLLIEPNDLALYGSDKRRGKKLANEYDFFLAEAQYMGLVGRYLGTFLGPRGKMPTPITLTTSIEDVVRSLRNSVRIRVRTNPQIKCRIGVEGMKIDEMVENVEAILSKVVSRMPKGIENIESIYVKGTMTPAVKVSLGGG